MRGKEVFDKGLIWLIGSGESIKVVAKQWIPNLNNYVLPFPIDSRWFDLRVSNLIFKHGI